MAVSKASASTASASPASGPASAGSGGKGSRRKKGAETPLLDEHSIGLEGRIQSGDHQSLKLWLRLLSCSTQIETLIGKRLRSQFGMTLPRFDYLAQLHRNPDGLRMNVLSRYLMVTGGNVTGLTDELEKAGLVERVSDEADRRSLRVRLTPEGQTRFLELAAAHEAWIIEIFAALPASDQDHMRSRLGHLRVHLAGISP